MNRVPYPTDLTDAEWHVIAPQLPEPSPCGRPRVHSERQLLDAILQLRRSGGAWRRRPHAFPPWKTGFHSFRRWRLDGTWARLTTALRRQLRTRLGRDPEPSGGMVDSQSVTTTRGGGRRGYDGAKQLSGRTRHLLVDTLGLVVHAPGHAADVQDRAAVPLLLTGANDRVPRLEHVWVDQGQTGAGTAWIERALGWTGTVVQHPPQPRGAWVPLGTGADPRPFTWRPRPPERTGCRGVLPRRWVGERTCAWLGHNRRLSKDYERLCETREALIYGAMSRLMARRLATT